MKRHRIHIISFVVAALVFALSPAVVFAMVDDAHSLAMEVATPYVEKGFRVRSDYWNGEVKPGEKKAVRHQMFKGNEYCFWLGVDADDIILKIAIYDSKGNPVKVEVVDGNNATAVRVLPPKTGTYIIVFTIELKDKKSPAAKEPVPWALAYGYR